MGNAPLMNAFAGNTQAEKVPELGFVSAELVATSLLIPPLKLAD